jgi:L-fucose mutarotase/ribose pyranase (RbsD/FucU family)
MKRFDFYDMAQDFRATLSIATGESSHFANLLLKVGFLNEDSTPNH